MAASHDQQRRTRDDYDHFWFWTIDAEPKRQGESGSFGFLEAPDGGWADPAAGGD